MELRRGKTDDDDDDRDDDADCDDDDDDDDNNDEYNDDNNYDNWTIRKVSKHVHPCNIFPFTVPTASLAACLPYDNNNTDRPVD